MTKQEANKIVKDIESICDEYYPQIHHNVLYDSTPDLKTIVINISIKFLPKYTRKMELKR